MGGVRGICFFVVFFVFVFVGGGGGGGGGGASPMAYGSSPARDQSCATAVTQATAGTVLILNLLHHTHVYLIVWGFLLL